MLSVILSHFLLAACLMRTRMTYRAHHAIPNKSPADCWSVLGLPNLVIDAHCVRSEFLNFTQKKRRKKNARWKFHNMTKYWLQKWFIKSIWTERLKQKEVDGRWHAKRTHRSFFFFGWARGAYTCVRTWVVCACRRLRRAMSKNRRRGSPTGQTTALPK